MYPWLYQQALFVSNDTSCGVRSLEPLTAPSSLHHLDNEFFIMGGVVAPLVPDICAERGHCCEVYGLELPKADICTDTGAWVEI